VLVPAAELPAEIALLCVKWVVARPAAEALQHRPPDLVRADLDGAVVEQPGRRGPGTSPQLLEAQYGPQPLVPAVLELDESAAPRDRGVHTVQSPGISVEERARERRPRRAGHRPRPMRLPLLSR
jgi:hypothetical protein